MGHSTLVLALDRYTRALRGSEADTAAKPQAFIEQSRGTVVGQSDPAVSGRAVLSDASRRQTRSWAEGWGLSDIPLGQFESR